MVFIRKIKIRNRVYLAKVKSVRENGKVKQKFVKYIGREINNKPVRRVSTENIELRAVKRSLDILVIHKISEFLKLKSLIQNDYCLSLVYSQLLDKKSIYKLEEWFKHTEIPDVLGIELTTEKLYDSLNHISEIDFYEVENELYRTFRKYKKEKDSAIIDVTDTYFEGNSEKIKSRKGKEGKVRKLVQIGLAVTLEHGFPILQTVYHGNLSNFQIFKDMIVKLRNKEFFVVIMDRGMLSKDNLKLILGLRVKTIAGLRKTETLKRDFLSKIKRESIFSYKNMVKLKNTSVYIKSFNYMNGKLIAVYNPSLEIIKKESNFEKGLEGDKYVGYSFIYHNTDIDDEIVVKKYFEKDMIERAFKQLKGVLRLRPIRVWLKENVIGHVRICYLAYAILALMNYKLRRLKVSSVDVLESFKQGYKVNLYDKEHDFSWDLTVPLEPEQEKILRALSFRSVVNKN